jgi:hypothetical protein
VDAERMIQATLDLGVWGAALDPDAYIGVARRAGFEPDRCARSMLGDEALLRVDPRFIHNAHLLAAVAAEAPACLEHWASMVVTSYSEILDIEPLISSSLLTASQLDPNASEVSEERRAQNSQVIAALRGVVRHDASRPETDPLEAAIARWLLVVEPEQRALTLERLLAQVAAEDAEALRERLA